MNTNRCPVTTKSALILAALLWIAAPVPGATVEDYSRSNSVTVALGGDERGHGLKHVSNPGDGITAIESVDGVAARVGRLARGRSSMTFCFQINPAFKNYDLGRVRIEVEYLDPEPGTMGLLYDALDDKDVTNPTYRDGDKSVRLNGSKTWQKAVFRTRGDAGFNSRQSGKTDFRFWARTPALYVRKVTVSREGFTEENWGAQFAASNRVTVLLGQEKPDREGLRLLDGDDDEHHAAQVIDGVPCRFMNRAVEGRMFSSFYFAISPAFKSSGLTNARVEVEYLARPDAAIRVQFDAMDGGRHRKYRPVLADRAPAMRFGTGADYGRVSRGGVWDVATFHLTNAVFWNSQKYGADFRIEVVPPEIHVRRVTVSREGDARRP